MIISTETLLNLRTALKAAFQAGFDGAPSQWETVAMKQPSSSAQQTYGWLGQFPRMREFVGDRVIQNLAQHDYSIKNRKFELTVGVKRDDIEDDQLGQYNTIAQGLGNEAKIHPDELVFGLLKDGMNQLCYDGQNFLDTDHPVGGQSVSNFQDGAGPLWFLMDTTRPIKPLIYQERSSFEFTNLDQLDDPNVFMREEFLYGTRGRDNAGFGLWQLLQGSKADLTKANFLSARVAMTTMKGDTGRILGLRPNILMVSPQLEETANALMKADQIAGSTNTVKGLAEVVVCPWLA